MRAYKMTDPNRAEKIGAMAPWPKGKRRNPSERWLNETLPSLQHLLNQHDRTSSLRTGCNQAGLARFLKIGTRTASRWVSGDDVPSAESQTAIRRWIRSHAGKG